MKDIVTSDCGSWVASLLLSEDFIGGLKIRKSDSSGRQKNNNNFGADKSEPQRLFIKGPIPDDWIEKACQLGKGCGDLSWPLWHLHGMYNKHDSKENRSFPLSNKLLEKYGISKLRKSNALKALEGAGLISIVQEPGSLPIVTMIFERIKIRSN